MEGRIVIILHDGKELSEAQLDKLATTFGSITPVSFVQIRDCSTFNIPIVEPQIQPEKESEIDAVKAAFKEIEFECRRQIRTRSSLQLAVAITAKLSKKGSTKLGVAVEVIARATKDSVFYNIANCYGITPDMVEAIITASKI